jgi:hypothetical protein
MSAPHSSTLTLTTGKIQLKSRVASPDFKLSDFTVTLLYLVLPSLKLVPVASVKVGREARFANVRVSIQKLRFKFASEYNENIYGICSSMCTYVHVFDSEQQHDESLTGHEVTLARSFKLFFNMLTN